MIHSLEGCHIDSMINFQQIRGQNRGLTDQSQGWKLISAGANTAQDGKPHIL